MRHHFHDRRDAGQRLARRLEALHPWVNTVVLALPRGGVPVGSEVALLLDAPFDVLLVRKLGVPGHEELALGAIASGGVLVLNNDIVAQVRATPEQIDEITAHELKELGRRERTYRGNRRPVTIVDRQVIVVDDGLATGATMRAAVIAIRAQAPGRITVAVPVAAVQACEAIGMIADEFICLLTPESFTAVGYWYEHFGDTSDEEVHSLLADAAARNDRRVA